MANKDPGFQFTHWTDKILSSGGIAHGSIAEGEIKGYLYDIYQWGIAEGRNQEKRARTGWNARYMLTHLIVKTDSGGTTGLYRCATCRCLVEASDREAHDQYHKNREE